MVGLETEARLPRGDPECFRSPHPRERALADRIRQTVARHDQLPPRPPLRWVAVDRPVGRVGLPGPSRRRDRTVTWPVVDPRERLTLTGLEADGLAQDGTRRTHVGDLDAQHEAHGVQPRHERRCGSRLQGDPQPLSVVDEVEVVLDMTLRGQHE